ncbi:MAG TPA: hypothetical protein VL001_00155 [Candidimonas sp.]|nr:hypothetical protein [Candidimonas sp.]
MTSEPSLVLALPAATLVFGMEWQPTVGARAQRLGSRLARQQRASHMVVAGDTAGSIGVVALKPAGRPQKASMHSAAQNVALLFGVGTIALVLELEGRGHWLVAVHEGAVIARTDTLFLSRDAAGRVLAELHQAYPRLVLLGEAQSPAVPTVVEIAAASSALSRLTAVRRWTAVFPWPVQLLGLFLVLILLVPRLWKVWRPADRAEARAIIDPASAWRLATNKALQAHRVHGVPGTRSLLDSLYTIPVDVSGWTLAQVECRPDTQWWRCQARYERRSHEASNSGFLHSSPSHWTTAFTSMEQAEPSWRTDAHSMPLAGQPLKTHAQNDKELLSSLQAIRAAFAQLQFHGSVPLAVVAPRDARGSAIARPADMVVFMSRKIKINGPLRSGGMLLPYTSAIGWHKAVLTLGDVERPSLKRSRLHLSLEGALYEVASVVPQADPAASD